MPTMERRLPDRRSSPRGGRRPTDPHGFSPMVMVVESDDTRRTITETILASLRFAVAPVPSVEGALAICRGMTPSVIVCNVSDESRVREGLRPLVIPIVATDAAPEALDEVVERIRLAVRGASRVR